MSRMKVVKKMMLLLKEMRTRSLAYHQRIVMTLQSCCETLITWRRSGWPWPQSGWKSFYSTPPENWGALAAGFAATVPIAAESAVAGS